MYLLQEKMSKLYGTLNSTLSPSVGEECKTKFNDMMATVNNTLVPLETKIDCVQTFYASFWSVEYIHAAMIADFDGRGSILSLCQCIRDTLQDSLTEFYQN